MNAIPKDLQLPLVVVVGLVGFLIVIGLSSISARKDSSSSSTTNDRAVQFQDGISSPQTNKSTTPIAKKSGSVMTPDGRRSARIARKSRKED